MASAGGGPAWDPNRAAREAAAKLAKEKALKHLDKEGQGKTQYEKALEKYGVEAAEKVRDKHTTRDNTLEAIRERNIEKKKEALEEESRKQKEADDAAGGRLAPGWHEASDPLGRKYYFSEVTQETTWERPVTWRNNQPPPPPLPPSIPMQGTAGNITSTPTQNLSTGASPIINTAPINTSEKEKASEHQGEKLLEGWKRTVHAATGQVFYVHEGTKERRRTPPSASGDVPTSISSTDSSSQPPAKKSRYGEPVGPFFPQR